MGSLEFRNSILILNNMNLRRGKSGETSASLNPLSGLSDCHSMAAEA